MKRGTNDVGKRPAKVCETLETVGRNGRFRAAAETLAVQLGRGNWTAVPNKQGRAALGSQNGTVAWACDFIEG